MRLDAYDVAGAQQPCPSACQPAHRLRPGNQRDFVRYRNRMKELDQSLPQYTLEAEVASFLEPFDALEHDVEYWKKALEVEPVVIASGLIAGVAGSST